MDEQIDGFVKKAMEIVTQDGGDTARGNIARYFDKNFTGSHFDVVADHENPNVITARDIVAVSTLSVTIPPRVAIWLLSDEGARTCTPLLESVPHDVDLWEQPELLTWAEGPLRELWDILDDVGRPQAGRRNHMGPVKKSKLLAAKRPRLVPIHDSVIRGALPPVKSEWEAFKALVSDEDRRKRILEATATAPTHLSLMRRLDIALWMHNQRTK